MMVTLLLAAISARTLDVYLPQLKSSLIGKMLDAHILHSTLGIRQVFGFPFLTAGECKQITLFGSIESIHLMNCSRVIIIGNMPTTLLI